MARRRFKDRSKWDRDSTGAFAAIVAIVLVAVIAIVGIMFLVPVETG